MLQARRLAQLHWNVTVAVNFDQRKVVALVAGDDVGVGRVAARARHRNRGRVHREVPRDQGIAALGHEESRPTRAVGPHAHQGKFQKVRHVSVRRAIRAATAFQPEVKPIADRKRSFRAKRQILLPGATGIAAVAQGVAEQSELHRATADSGWYSSTAA